MEISECDIFFMSEFGEGKQILKMAAPLCFFL